MQLQYKPDASTKAQVEENLYSLAKSRAQQESLEAAALRLSTEQGSRIADTELDGDRPGLD